MKKIVVEHLKYRYPGTERLALDDISFDVDDGEIVGVIGRNGAGKSTLCQALVGLVPHFYKGAYGGKVLIDGMEVKSHTVSDIAFKAGIVFQNPFTQITGSKMTVYEEIGFGLEHMGLSRREMIERIDYVLDLLNITEVKDHNPFDLSGGQMQRLAIASIIVMKPDIIVMDEPTSQLDPQGTDEVFQAMERLSEEGMTVVLVEQKMEKVAEYCNRVLLLDKGKKIAFDTPATIFSRDDLETYGIKPPVYTSLCKALHLRDEKSAQYPVTLEEVFAALKRDHT